GSRRVAESFGDSLHVAERPEPLAGRDVEGSPLRRRTGPREQRGATPMRLLLVLHPARRELGRVRARLARIVQQVVEHRAEPYRAAPPARHDQLHRPVHERGGVAAPRSAPRPAPAAPSPAPAPPPAPSPPTAPPPPPSPPPP